MLLKYELLCYFLNIHFVSRKYIKCFIYIGIYFETFLFQRMYSCLTSVDKDKDTEKYLKEVFENILNYEELIEMCVFAHAIVIFKNRQTQYYTNTPGTAGGQNIGGEIISHMGDSPKWVKSKKRRKRRRGEKD